MTTTAYDRHKARRQVERERALQGETLAAYFARAHAKPPTLAEIFAKNRADTTRCPSTPNLLEWKPRSRKASRK